MMRLLSLILITMLAGCLPKQEVRTASIADDSQGSNDADTSTSDVELAWYQSLTSSTVLSLYRDNTENTYVRGRRIENYLLRQNSPSTSYCLEVDLGDAVPVTDRRYLRLRAVPLSVNNVATKTKTIYLRVDFGNAAAGAAVCNLDKVQYINDSATEYITYTSIQTKISFTLGAACSSCATQIQSKKFKLFSVDTANSRMVQVKTSELDLGLLTLELKPGSAPSSGSSCTNSSCSALGYDCCLSNQCVNDGSVRAEVTGTVLTSNEFLSAEQEKLSNALAFLKYPQFYYICGTSQPQVPPTGGSQNDADAAAAARLLEMQKDYACIQHLKSKSAATPFHLAPFNSLATYDQTKCNTVTSSNSYYWETVLKRLYTNCGCASSNNTLALQLANCPKYDYQVVAQNSSLQPIQFACTTIDEDSDDGSFQDQNVSVNSRTVPHRFFDATGTEVDLTANPASTTTQEGQGFTYADPEKTQPVNGTFNMNSILGQMNVNLTDSMPASVVNVELDKVYLIATRSGYYTSCPTCAKDSWFASFSAHPSVGQGVGLQAIGHSTSRDTWDNNTSLGNYEDTIFGRACWVPPTMLPFSQPVSGATSATDSNIGPQRIGRLKTQAALWANGYQRDWFGFNQGALIGSFDGVTWFAVGKGRLVRSTTKKLFLAINAPFGDLAESNNHVVSVQDYEGQATAALLDFHPEYVQNHPNQNEAGSCQAYHMCNVDSDCITRLGWEYACADVTQLKTYWPGFYPDGAKERAMTSGDTAKSIEGILAQGVLPSGSTKRCVYRGAGSLCRTDAGNIAAADMEKRKLLTCAPNFWCADVDSTNVNIPNTSTNLNVFNREVARFAQELDEIPVANNHFYGRDTNQLGRPLDYVHNKYTTPANSLGSLSDSLIRSTLNNNGAAIDAAAVGKIGLCRPGKRLPLPADVATQWNPFNQHQALDEFSRTDYINQIASCPSNYLSLGVSKVASCPVLGDDGNYLHQSSDFASATQTTWSRRALEQNGCGLETLRNGTITTGMTADQMQNVSPFKSIEGKPLNLTVNVLPGVTRDACMRKPGSVCHTDMDCSPNKYHADQTQYFNNSYFGNTANREYYEQYLVCGQGTPKPYISDPEFNDYDITKNVCCREVGKDITTYSAQEASGTNADSTVAALLNPLATGTTEPTNVGRYERFSHVRNLGTTLPVLTAYDGRNTVTGVLATTSYVGALSNGVSVPANVMTSGQWKTLDAGNAKTCCGGGWVRKFADGSNDWTKRDRFSIDVSNFRCLNYLTPLATTVTPQATWGISQSRIDADYSKYCHDISGATGNCAQISIQQGTIDDVSCATREYATSAANPYVNPFVASFATLPGEIAWTDAVNIFAFFPPTSADTSLDTLMDFSNTANRKNITISMPSYVADSTITVEMLRRDSSNVFSSRTCVNTAGLAATVTDYTSTGTCAQANGCCYEYNTTTRILVAAINQTATGTPFFDSASPTTNGRYGVKVSFTPPGVGPSGDPLAKAACTDVHYLDNLGRMELAGIPQITYPKILCNNNAERLVPDLFTIADSDNNRASFNTPTFAFNDTVDWRTNHHGLANGAIFSQHDFKCCTPLGKTTKDATTCCSGFGVEVEEDGTGGRKDYMCKLPAGANLSVYMNRFVSNEGTGAHLEVSPLVESDFNAQTGEPLITSAVNAKLANIGSVVCENGTTRRGGAFGEFAPEPSSVLSSGETVYGIVDSPSDNGTSSSGGSSSNVGYNAFVQGYRWNHHLYCQ